MRSTGNYVLPLVLLLALLAAPSAAVPATAQESDPEVAARISQLYQRSRGAETPEAFTELLAELEEIEGLAITESQSAYLVSLAGWLLNERGETQLDAALAAYDRGDDEAAAQLEDEALADFNAAIERDPANWQALHNRGVSMAEIGDDEAALADFNQVIELHPETPKVWFNRAEILYDQGRYEEAIADYTQVLALTPNDVSAIVARGHARLRLGQASEALEDYQRAVRQRPNDAVAIVSRGDAYAALGRWNEAAADFRRAIELDDQLAWAYQRAAWFMATCPRGEFRQPALAIEAAQQAIALDEYDDWRNYDALAAAQARNGDYAAAAESIATAQALAENEGDDAAAAELADRAALYASEQPYTLPSP